MIPKDNLTLVDSQTGNLAFKLYHFEKYNPFDEIQRLNYYSMIWIKNGKGTLKADFSKYQFDGNFLFSFSPYQPFVFNIEDEINGWVINFHPDFFCIHKHHKDVACNGVLFNNIYSPPFVRIDEKTQAIFENVIEQLKTEMQNAALAQYELLISYLIIFLITGSRQKTEQHAKAQELTANKEESFVLQNLKNAIEFHYKTKHSAKDYADLLSISPKALSKLTKTHLNKTLSDLIAERIIIEAKRELYLTHKTVKEIAFELGYTDEYYFSRFFKKNAAIAPQIYRETVGFDRANAT